MTRLVFLLLVLLASGCGSPCGSSMLESDGALAVTADEHGEGWGLVDCGGCHSAASIHQNVCLDEVDYDELWELDGDYGECIVCHGDNGVSP